MNLTDDALIQVLSKRFAQSRKAFSDLSVVNRKLTEMNRRLEQSESLKSNFLSNIRNEINNPLNGIIGLANELLSINHGNDEMSTVASMICSEANTLDFQMRNIFMAAELEAGVVDPHIATTNVTTIVNEVADSFRHNAARKAVQILLELPVPDDTLYFATDAEKLQVIISNLLANAVEYSHEDGIITIRLRIDDQGRLVVEVADRGIGIAQEDLGRIFDRFVQLETGTTRTHSGHGLGLSIAKALTDLLQGAITVESSPGTGTQFTVTLSHRSIVDDESMFIEGGTLFFFDEMSEK